MRDVLDLAAIAVFVQIAEAGSLSAAARRLGLPKATVSRLLASLEKKDGRVARHALNTRDAAD